MSTANCRKISGRKRLQWHATRTVEGAHGGTGTFRSTPRSTEHYGERVVQRRVYPGGVQGGVQQVPRKSRKVGKAEKSQKKPKAGKRRLEKLRKVRKSRKSGKVRKSEEKPGKVRKQEEKPGRVRKQEQGTGTGNRELEPGRKDG